MAVDDIVKKILSDADMEASNIKKKAEKKAEEILKVAEKQAQNKKNEYLDSFNQYMKQTVQKIITNANMEAKRIILVAKSEVIDEVFKLAAKEIDKTRLPKKIVVLKDGQKEEAVNPEDFLMQLKLKLATPVAKTLNIE